MLRLSSHGKKEYMTILRQVPLRERSRKGLSVAAAHALLKIAKDQWYTESVKVICEELEKGLGDLVSEQIPPFISKT